MSEKDKQLLYSVEELFADFKFNIPEYQRGYKWTTDNVKKMLDDINNFQIDGERYYCLQNITITPNNKDKEVFDVIDGQQRLTSLVILLSYLHKSELIKEKLKYSIRDVSHEFLNEYIIDKQEAHKYYDDSSKEKKFTNEFLENSKLKEYDYQDIFYFVQASYTIDNWLKTKNPVEFKEKLLQYVKLIVNNVGKSDKQEKIFANLNSNKVALTDVDLIRAILITRSVVNTDEDETSDIVRINEHRVKLGWELDQFHIWWSDPSVSKLFSVLTNSKNAPLGIELLYLLFWQRANPKQGLEEFRYRLDNDGKAGIECAYEEIRTFHHTMQDWYQDSEIYHYIGFLGTQKIIKIKELWDLWTQEHRTRKEFIKELKRIIFNDLVAKKDVDVNKNKLDKEVVELYDNIKNIKYPWYSDSSSAKILVLMDIIQILTQKENKELRRLPTEYFTKSGGGDDLEHVFCQTPNKKTTYYEAFINIEHIKKVVEKALNGDNLDGKTSKILNKILSEYKNDEFGQWENNKDILSGDDRNTYMEFLGIFEVRNSIGNLLLLDFTVNRSYGNDEYMKKRNRIVEETQAGTYIRPHTWTVFTKTFGNKNKARNLHEWGIDDIQAHATYIAEKLQEHFGEVKNV